MLVEVRDKTFRFHWETAIDKRRVQTEILGKHSVSRPPASALIYIWSEYICTHKANSVLGMFEINHKIMHLLNQTELSERNSLTARFKRCELQSRRGITRRMPFTLRNQVSIFVARDLFTETLSPDMNSILQKSRSYSAKQSKRRSSALNPVSKKHLEQSKSVGEAEQLSQSNVSTEPLLLVHVANIGK